MGKLVAVGLLVGALWGCSSPGTGDRVACVSSAVCGEGRTCDADAGVCRALRACDPAARANLCCCEYSDVAGNLVCSDGQWTCEPRFRLYTDDACRSTTCGSPCSWPCMNDMAH